MTKTALKTALTLLEAMETDHPRRKFVLREIEGSYLLEAPGCYTKIHVRGQSRGVVSLGHIKNRHNLRFDSIASARRNVVDMFGMETRVRERHNHQRSELRKHINKLKQTEMFAEQAVEFLISGFGPEDWDEPKIQMKFIGLDTVFAEIRYSHYRNDSPPCKHTHSVSFGYKRWFCKDIQEVIEVFDSPKVFMHLDNKTEADAIKIARRPSSGIMDFDVGVIPYEIKDICEAAPYLLVMNSEGFSVVDVEVNSSPVLPDTEIVYEQTTNKAIATLFTKTQKKKCVLFHCCSELAWQRIYEGVEQDENASD